MKIDCTPKNAAMHFNVIHISGNNVINIPQIELLLKELVNQRVQLTSKIA